MDPFSLKTPRSAFHSTNKPTTRVSSLAWASLTQVSFRLRVPGLHQHCTPCTSTWKHPWPTSSPLPSGHLPIPSQNWGCSLCHLDQTGPFPRPKRLGFRSYRRGWQSALSPDWGLLSLGLRCRARPKASALSETGAGPGTRLWGKKGALTLLETAVDLLVLQQLLAVVLKRLISRVRHDEKPPLIGDAGNGHGRPGGGRGGARQESLPGGAGSRRTPPLPVCPASALHFSNVCVSLH